MGGPDRSKQYKVAVVWRGDAAAREAATPQNNRFYRIFEELAAAGIYAEPAVYDEDCADEVREQLLAADGVLIWVDPIHQGKTREALDPLLCDVAQRGPWVSAHPDVILKMGVKEVLYRTRHLGWAPKRISIERPPNSLPTFRHGCNRPVLACSSKTGVMAARACGRSNCCQEVRSACSTRSVAASWRSCRCETSWHAASPISAGAGVSSTNRSSRACPKG